MDWINILLQAIVQGVSEFLPISSSGHLVIAGALFPGSDVLTDRQLAVSIALHAGTLVSIMAFYRQRIFRLLGEDRRAIGLLIVGSVPAAVFGLTAKKLFETTLLVDPLVAGLMLPVTGLILLWGARREPGEMSYERISYRAALVVGCFQALAILPGISRSGATIVSGVAVGMTRQSAAAFAFLLALPAIGGATLLETIDLAREGISSELTNMLLAGAAVSAVVGYAALWLLTRIIERGRLHWFAFWVIPLGVAVVIWQLAIR